MNDDDQFIVTIPEWVDYLKVERDADGWHATVQGDPRGTGILQTAEAFGDSPAEAASTAFDKAEGWTGFALEQEATR